MKRLATILAALLICTAASADRPKVGVVFCGGGAKGAAHVGVLKVLEENGIPIDYIVGASMGSIMGGLYAIGYSADELHDLLLAQDWNSVMNDKIARRDLAYEHKKGYDKYVLHIPFGVGDLSNLSSEKKDSKKSLLSNIPLALVNGQNIYNLFTKLSVGYQDSLDFNKMPIPFACVAVDLVSKKEVVFHSGNFVDAIRSSMAIPGYFAPVKMGDMVLVDGGTLNNYPVDVVKAMGADIVIGVLLGASDPKDHRITDIGAMASEMMDLFLDVKLADNINNTDILITPSVKGYSVLSFDTQSLDSLMVNGERAAREKQDELLALKRRIFEEDSLKSEAFVGPEQKIVRYNKARHIDNDTITIGGISLYGLDAKEISKLLRKTIFKPGVKVTGTMIEEQIEKFYSTGMFESVTYALKGTQEPYDLELKFVKGKPSSLNAGFRFDTEEIASIILNVGLNNRSFAGHRFGLTAKLAYNMQAEAYYSYGFLSNTQFNFKYKFRKSDLNMFKEETVNAFKFDQHSFIADFSTQRTKYWHSDIGAKIDMFQYVSMLSYVGEQTDRYDLDPSRRFFLDAFVNFSFDNMDKPYFPTRGIQFEAEADYINSRIFESEEAKHPSLLTASLNFTGVIPFGDRFALIPSLKHRSIFGEQAPGIYANMMGGFEAHRYTDQQMTFIGITHTKVFDKNVSSATLDARVRFLDNHYATLSGVMALDYHTFQGIFEEKPFFGVRLGYSYDSVVGPLSANIIWSNITKQVGAYLSIGYSF